MPPSFTPPPALADQPSAHTPTSTSVLALTPYPAYFTSFSLMATIIPLVKTGSLGYPILVSLPIFSSIFAGTGYMINQGDSLNGSGTATAWSGIFLFFNAKNAFKSGRVGPISTCGVVGGMGAIYGWDYFQQ